MNDSDNTLSRNCKSGLRRRNEFVFNFVDDATDGDPDDSEDASGWEGDGGDTCGEKLIDDGRDFSASSDGDGTEHAAG